MRDEDRHLFPRDGVSVKIPNTEVKESFPDWQYSVCIKDDAVLTLVIVDDGGSIFGILLGSALCAAFTS